MVALAALGAIGCSDPRPAPAPGATDVSVELGVPGGPDGLDFEPLEEGAELRLKTFGQGGTHVYLAARCVGFGNRAFVAFRLKNLDTDVEIASPAPVRPQLLYCSEADPTTCDLVPSTVLTSGLTLPHEEREGLHVVIGLDVRDDQDSGLEATDSREVVLSTADL
jgi:hypothetical protein